MFGNKAAFVNGNMFAGLFGERLFVRLPEDRAQAVRDSGGALFEPMPGRPMRGYVTLPEGWPAALDAAGAWVVEALGFTARLPAKEPGGRKSKKAQ